MYLDTFSRSKTVQSRDEYLLGSTPVLHRAVQAYHSVSALYVVHQWSQHVSVSASLPRRYPAQAHLRSMVQQRRYCCSGLQRAASRHQTAIPWCSTAPSHPCPQRQAELKPALVPRQSRVPVSPASLQPSLRNAQDYLRDCFFQSSVYNLAILSPITHLEVLPNSPAVPD